MPPPPPLPPNIQANKNHQKQTSKQANKQTNNNNIHFKKMYENKQTTTTTTKERSTTCRRRRRREGRRGSRRRRREKKRRRRRRRRTRRNILCVYIWILCLFTFLSCTEHSVHNFHWAGVWHISHFACSVRTLKPWTSVIITVSSLPQLPSQQPPLTLFRLLRVVSVIFATPQSSTSLRAKHGRNREAGMAESVCRSEKLAMSKAPECLPKLIQLGLSLFCFPTDCNIFVTCMYSFCSKNRTLHFTYIYKENKRRQKKKS